MKNVCLNVTRHNADDKRKQNSVLMYAAAVIWTVLAIILGPCCLAQTTPDMATGLSPYAI